MGACGIRRGDNGGGGGATSAAWYDNSTLAAAWEGLAARAAVTSPNGRGNGSADQQEGDTPSWNLPTGLWLNRLMYQDVVAKHNSELPYLLPLVRHLLHAGAMRACVLTLAKCAHGSVFSVVQQLCCQGKQKHQRINLCQVRPNAPSVT